jgi:hypothetical protein
LGARRPRVVGQREDEDPGYAGHEPRNPALGLGVAVLDLEPVTALEGRMWRGVVRTRKRLLELPQRPFHNLAVPISGKW